MHVSQTVLNEIRYIFILLDFLVLLTCLDLTVERHYKIKNNHICGYHWLNYLI